VQTLSPSPPRLLAFDRVTVQPPERGSVAGVLRDVSFTLDPGEVLGVLGPARSSKSTLLRVAAGLIRPASGSVRVEGEDPTRVHTAVRGRIGLAGSHDRSFNPRLSARENLEFFARLHGFASRSAAEEAIAGALEAMDLGGALTRPVGAFPTGLLLRLSIARALLGRPKLLLLDEPTSGLEHGRRDRFYALLGEMAGVRGMGLVWATRDLTEAQYLCSRVLLIDEGRISRDGLYLEVEPHAEALFRRESAEGGP
jgi:ABC-type multidrug transport system ATPase subunit